MKLTQQHALVYSQYMGQIRSWLVYLPKSWQWGTACSSVKTSVPKIWWDGFSQLCWSPACAPNLEGTYESSTSRVTLGEKGWGTTQLLSVNTSGKGVQAVERATALKDNARVQADGVKLTMSKCKIHTSVLLTITNILFHNRNRTEEKKSSPFNIPINGITWHGADKGLHWITTKISFY